MYMDITSIITTLSPLFLAVAPVIVKWATNRVKSLEGVKFSAGRKPLLRFAAATLALASAIAHVWAFGGAIDESLVSSVLQAGAEAFAFYWGANGIYHISKSNGRE